MVEVGSGTRKRRKDLDFGPTAKSDPVRPKTLDPPELYCTKGLFMEGISFDEQGPSSFPSNMERSRGKGTPVL